MVIDQGGKKPGCSGVQEKEEEPGLQLRKREPERCETVRHGESL